MSIAQRGHFKTDRGAGVAVIAAAPQCGQCLLPTNSMPKHDAQAIVASFDSQNWQRGSSDEIAAPQFGQLRVSACIGTRTSLRAVRGHPCPHSTLPSAPPVIYQKSAGRIDNCCAMLSLHFRQ